MSLSKISPNLKKKEDDIQQQVYDSINEFQDIIFNAGAGAGKTYSLIESMKYIVNKYGDKLNFNNQKIMCITYTNVATKEIKERIGNSELVEISTIHLRLWELIKSYQEELLAIHVENLEKLNEELLSELETIENYKDLTKELKDSFKDLMLHRKDKFYEIYDKKAPEVKEVFEKDLEDYPKILKSASRFQKTVNTIFKIDNYNKCLSNIKDKKDNYKSIKYDPNYNSDVLHRMIISHDTLLEYSLRLIEKYSLFRQIIIDKYPYIFIDEYQDSSENVIKIMNYISKHASDIQRNNFIGYFGDTVQNIYDEGVGNEIEKLHTNLKTINKKFNRRSYKEIIDTINNIRNDDITQESIFEDCIGGSVKFYTGDNDNIYEFIEKYKSKWEINSKNKLHCFVLTNKLIAELNGMNDLYKCFSETKYYKKNFKQLNQEILSEDLQKLGDIPRVFYRIIKLNLDIKRPDTPLTDLIDKDIYYNMSFKDLNELLEILNSLKGNSLKEYLKSIYSTYQNTENHYYKQFVKELINLEDYSYKEFYKYLASKLFSDFTEDEIEDINIILNSLLDIELTQYYSWYRFINQEASDDVVFHTYHGAKGLEFKNVIVIMQNDFGAKDKNKFPFFFKNYENLELSPKEIIKVENTKNLMYVACSRAIKNLRILYLNDVTDFQSGVEKIFGNIHTF